MIITAINGSYRAERGYTNFLIELLFQGAREAGAKCSTVHLADCYIERCLACGRCQSKKNQRPCVHEQTDDVAAIFRRMKESDLIIYATPLYVFAMSGLLKTFLERFYAKGVVSDLTVSKKGLIFHKITAAICSKPFVTLVCSDNLERETPQNVIDYFATSSKFTDAPQVGLLVRNGGQLS
ncbi:MAG: flavodoxin family protein, partial [Syntrophaceae bacterium]|nr:flavodoxin family protein [Syntrophaceae bacterium]